MFQQRVRLKAVRSPTFMQNVIIVRGEPTSMQRADCLGSIGFYSPFTFK